MQKQRNRYKLSNFYFAFFIVIISKFIHSAEFSVINKINIENMITEQLSTELNRFLPPKSFVVFTSVKLKVFKSKEILESEVLKSTPLVKKPKKVPIVPGFNIYDNETKFEGGKEERQVYGMVEKERITKIYVKIIFNKLLPQELVKTSKSIVIEKLKSSYENKVEVSFIKSDLSYQSSHGLSGSWLSLLPKDWNLKNILNNPIIWGIILLLLLALIISLLRRKSKKKNIPKEPIEERKETSTPIPPQTNLAPSSKEGLVKNLEKNQLEELTYEFISEVSDEPLVSRKYLMQLEKSDQKIIHATLRTDPLKKLLSQYLLLPENASTSQEDTLETKEKIDGLRDIINELKYFKKICQNKLQHPFGPLDFFSKVELSKLFTGKSSSEVYAGLDFLSSEQIRQVIDILPAKEKEDLLYLLKKNEPIPEEERKVIREKLQKDIQEVSNELKSEFANNESIIDIIIDNLQDDEEKLKEIFNSNKDLYEKYSYYMNSVEDVLNLDTNLVKKRIEDISNESLATILSGLPEESQKKFLEIIPESRKDLINSLLMTSKDIDQEKVRKEKKEFVKIFKDDFKNVGST